MSLKSMFCSHEVRLANHFLAEGLLFWECVKCGKKMTRTVDARLKWPRVDLPKRVAVAWAKRSRRQRKLNKRQEQKNG
jgi:hypothetical protein